MKRALLLYLTFIYGVLLYGQTPAHFILGEDKFAGAHIYDILQDDQLNYWIVGNNGVHKYDGYNFIEIKCNEMLSNSLFNLATDSENNIYCHNLSGQIFKITNDTCRLHYQIPDSLISPWISLYVDKDDHLIALTNRIFKIEEDKTPTLIIDSLIRLGNCTTDSENRLNINYHSHSTSKPYNLVYDNGKVVAHHELKKEKNVKTGYLASYRNTDGEIFYSCRISGTLLKKKKDSIIQVGQLNRGVTINRSFWAKGKFWIPSATSGVTSFTDITNPDKDLSHLFNDVKISTLCSDHEGNILLGTFNSGIIVLPESDFVNLNTAPIGSPINRITPSYNKGIAFGAADGKMGVIQLDGTIDYLVEERSTPIEMLGQIPSEKEYIIGSYRNAFIGADNPTSRPFSLSTLKDVVVIPNDQYLFAVNNGISLYRKGGNLVHPVDSSIHIPANKTKLKLYSGRTYRVEFDSIYNTIYIGASTGLCALTKDGEEKIQIDGKTVMASDLLYFNEKMYVATKSSGIYVFQNRQLIDHWTTDNILISNSIAILRAYDRSLYISTEKGIQEIDHTGKAIRFFNQSDGLLTEHLVDLEIHAGYLWALHQKGLQCIPLNSARQSAYSPSIALKEILVNNSSTSRKINEFKHDHNRFDFVLESKSLKYKNEIEYKYRLVGIESEWLIQPYQDNRITYKTLPPGSYELQVKAVYREKESETISYAFTISAPFWTKWWFYTIASILLLSIGYTYFIYQIKKQQRKAKLQEEIYESKLTAIQAQMNPHFIFNSLNSIQDLVLKNDAENAYIYISKFALLVRKTLNHSDHDFIDFAEEIATLELYLTLEKLRFKTQFDFQILAEEEEEEVLIPPMLIQPFIENALVHGLLHKDGKKHISIHFELTDKALNCTIRDNGIGRKEAKEIQKRQHTSHESFAVKAIIKRLEILELRYDGKFALEYIDHEENGQATGTSVILQIPYLSKY